MTWIGCGMPSCQVWSLEQGMQSESDTACSPSRDTCAKRCQRQMLVVRILAMEFPTTILELAVDVGVWSCLMFEE